MKGTIYCIHCISTGEKYIGQTRRSIQDRLRYHKYASAKSSRAKLYIQANKTGWDDFIIGIVEQCEVNQLNGKECFYIETFNTLEKGLNSSPGGGKFPVMKGKLHPLFGKGHKKETKLKISKNHHNVLGKNNPRSNYYEVEFLNGKKETVHCLTEWGRNNGYKKQNLFNLACNKCHRNFCCFIPNSYFYKNAVSYWHFHCAILSFKLRLAEYDHTCI